MDQRIIDLYDDFTHGGMSRRSFLDRLAALAGSTAAATALLPILQNNYAQAQTMPENDPRITAETVDIPGAPGLKGYLVKPKDAAGKLPTVIVIHENRGLNPHIKDVTRRMATEGFVALGLDYLSPMGGTPADEDKGREMIGQLKQPDVIAYGKAAVAYLKGRPDGNGKVGAVGFCWGGGAVNNLAVNEPEPRGGRRLLRRPAEGRGRAEDQGRDDAALRRPRRAHQCRHPGLRGGAEAGRQDLRDPRLRGRQPRLQQRHQRGALRQGSGRPAWSRTVAFLKKNLA